MTRIVSRYIAFLFIKIDDNIMNMQKYFISNVQRYRYISTLLAGQCKRARGYSDATTLVKWLIERLEHER